MDASVAPLSIGVAGPGQLWGLVEIFDREQIFGWVHVPEGDAPREVVLCLNGRRLTATLTAQSVERDLPFPVRQFRFRLNVVWRYVRKADRLTVELEGSPLHICGRGRTLAPDADGDLDKDQLFQRLSAGHVFNQKGVLQLSKELDAGWQKSVFGLYDAVRTFLKSRLDLELVVIYGTLLGAVRSGKLIGQDHDFDVGYISKKAARANVKKEALKIIHALAAEGFSVRVKNACTYVGHPAHGRAQIDIGRLFFDHRGELQSAFGFAGTKRYTRDDFSGYREIELEGRTVLTVNQPEELLACIYGDGWRVPNPGFHWVRERNRAARGARFTPEEITEITNSLREGRGLTQVRTAPGDH